MIIIDVDIYSFILSIVLPNGKKNIFISAGKEKVIMSHNNTFTTSLRHDFQEKW